MARWRVRTDSVEMLYNAIRALHPSFTPVRETARFGMNGDTFLMPYWFPVMLSGTVAAVLGVRQPYQHAFGRRTLLIATTLVAVVLGVVAISN